MSLNAFLSDIGASELSCKPGESAKLKQIETRLLDEIRSTRLELHNLLQSRLPEFNKTFQTAVDLEERIQSVTVQVARFEDVLSHPTIGLKDTLLTTLGRQAEVAREAQKQSTLLQCTIAIATFQKQLDSLAVLLDKGQLAAAVDIFPAIEARVSNVPGWVKGLAQWKDIALRRGELERRTKESLQSAFQGRVFFEGHNRLTVLEETQGQLPSFQYKRMHL